MQKLVACCTIAMMFGCSSAPAPGDEQSAAVPSDLVTSLEVEVGADTVGLVLHLTNSGTRPVVLEFNSAARYDFSVHTTAGTEVWRLSSDMMYAQVLGTETIEAGGSRRFTARWPHGRRAGMYQAVGRVLATNRTIEQRTQFEIRSNR